MDRVNNLIKYMSVLLLLGGLIAPAHAAPPSSFSKSKKILNTQVYNDQKISFYCGCAYQTAEITNRNGTLRNKEAVNHSSCDYEPRKSPKRAKYVEWEHVVPAHHLGHQLQCWQDGGRKACRKDPEFRVMVADLHNLVPVIGEVNGDRSNFRFGMIAGEPRRYGDCDFEVDFKQRVAEPAENVRGDIARRYFYMRDTYNIKLSKQQTKLLTAWSRLDPVSEWECERDRRIEAIQGHGNSYVKVGCVELAE